MAAAPSLKFYLLFFKCLLSIDRALCYAEASNAIKLAATVSAGLLNRHFNRPAVYTLLAPNDNLWASDIQTTSELAASTWTILSPADLIAYAIAIGKSHLSYHQNIKASRTEFLAHCQNILDTCILDLFIDATASCLSFDSSFDLQLLSVLHLACKLTSDSWLQLDSDSESNKTISSPIAFLLSPLDKQL